MFRIVRTTTLEALRRDSARVPELLASAGRSADQAGDAVARAERAQAEARRVRKQYDAYMGSSLDRLSQLRVRSRHPESGRCAQGDIALYLIREDLRRIRESGTPEEKVAVRAMQALLGEDVEPLGKDRDCPAPYAPPPVLSPPGHGALKDA
jgi:hypothetical protein